MAIKGSKKTTAQTRRFVFSAPERQRAITLTQSGKRVTVQKGVRFGNMNAAVEKSLDTEKSAAAYIIEQAGNFVDEGYKELSEQEHASCSDKLRFSCADDDLRNYPLSDKLRQCDLGDECSAERQDSGIKQAAEKDECISLGQRAAQQLLSNTELGNCTVVELNLPYSDIADAVKFLSDSDACLSGVETLILRAANLHETNNPQDDDDHSAPLDDYDDNAEDEAVVPCDCIASVFPSLKRLKLVGNRIWRLDGQQWQQLEEIEADLLLLPKLKLPDLKRLKFTCSDDYRDIEIDADFRPVSPAALLAAQCPKLEQLDMDVVGDLQIFEDILSSPLSRQLNSLRIGAFSNSDTENLLLLLTRFTLCLSRLKTLTLVLDVNSAKKSYIDRLKSFPLSLQIEYKQ